MSIKSKLGSLAVKAATKLKDKSPDIAVAVGIVGILGATVYACKATLKAKEHVDEHKQNLQDIEDNYEEGNLDDDEYKKEVVKEHAEFGLNIAKDFAGPVLLGTGSIYILLKHGVLELKDRNAFLTQVAGTAITKYQNLYQKTAQKYGADVANELADGGKLQQGEATVIMPNGKPKLKKYVEYVTEDGRELESDYMYVWYFGPNNKSFTDEPSNLYNYNALKLLQASMNDKYRLYKGKFGLWEFYEEFGEDVPLKLKKDDKLISLLRIAGWDYHPELPESHPLNTIDFGIPKGVWDLLEKGEWRGPIPIRPNHHGCILNFD